MRSVSKIVTNLVGLIFSKLLSLCKILFYLKHKLMRKLLLLPIILLAFALNAQTNSANLVSSNIDETLIDFTFQTYKLKTVTTPKGEEVIVLADDLSAIMDKGAPDLPKYTTSIVIPDLALMEVTVLSSKFTELQNIDIAPSKGNFTRNIDPKSVPYEYGRTYNKDEFYPKKLAALTDPYIIRDVRGQAVQVFPFQYNPITKTLRIYSEIKVKVSVKNQDGENQLIRQNNFNKVVKEYKNIYDNHFINYATTATRYTPVEEEGKMLIICYDDWMAEMQAFVDWKNTIGRPCEMVSVTTAGGTAANIKTFVENYYNTNGLTYLLLVGDSAQVPTNSGGGLGGDSDNAYGYITGSDHYQEFFVGRFSAETAAHVNTQVQRTITYEMGDQLQAGWLNKLTSIGSDQGPGDDGEMDYEHLRNIQTDLLGFTYENPPYEFFDGSQGGEDASGNPSAASVANRLNLGSGIINYTGHGSETSWATSGFNISDINNLTNNNKLPFVWSVGCVNGVFVNTTGFGESWLRAENNGEPTGAIAIMASTINQSWAPPMIAQDEMVDLLVGASAHGTKRTYAGISINGCFQMIEESNDIPMIDTWTCFGDPSLYVRTDNPSNMAISHNNEVIVGENTFNVNCDLENALATISKDGVIIGSAIVTGGIAAIPVDNLTPGDVLTVAVVGFNKVTYIATVTVIAPSGPYVVVDSCVNEIDFGQSEDLDMALKNVGVNDANTVTATISTTDANAIIANDTYSFGTIPTGSVSATSSNAFNLTVADNLVDQYQVTIAVEITDGTDTWSSNRMVTVNAPDFTIGNYTIDDSVSGNNDGILDPGETADIIIQVTNTGHADVTNVLSSLSTDFANLTLNNTTTTASSLTVGETGDFVFNVTADSSIADGTDVNVSFNVTGAANNQYQAQKDFSIIVGFVPEYCEAGASTADEFIQQVIFGDIDNSSVSGNTYTDYTDLSTNIQLGQSYDITIINGTNWDGDQMGCWIDWNYDGDFDDANESFVINYQENTPSSGLGTGTGTITVPTDARIGNTTMRLRVLYTDAISPCGDTNYGEVEDYTVNVEDVAAINDLALADINLFPNPNKGSFTINLKALNPLKTLIEVYSINGQLIYSKKAEDTNQTVNLNAATGVYLVKIVSENKIINKKIIIQ